MNKRPNHTLLNVSSVHKLSDFGVVDPLNGKVYDSLASHGLTEVSKNLILIDIGEENKDSFNEILFLLPEISLN